MTGSSRGVRAGPLTSRRDPDAQIGTVAAASAPQAHRAATYFDSAGGMVGLPAMGLDLSAGPELARESPRFNGAVMSRGRYAAAVIAVKARAQLGVGRVVVDALLRQRNPVTTRRSRARSATRARRPGCRSETAPTAESPDPTNLTVTPMGRPLARTSHRCSAMT